MNKKLKKIKILLIKNNLTQRELANKINISEEYLSKIISCKHIPNVNIALKIAQELNTTVEDIFT